MGLENKLREEAIEKEEKAKELAERIRRSEDEKNEILQLYEKMRKENESRKREGGAEKEDRWATKSFRLAGAGVGKEPGGRHEGSFRTPGDEVGDCRAQHSVGRTALSLLQRSPGGALPQRGGGVSHLLSLHNQCWIRHGTFSWHLHSS